MVTVAQPLHKPSKWGKSRTGASHETLFLPCGTVLVFLLTVAAEAQTVDRFQLAICAAMPDTRQRVECYDGLAREPGINPASIAADTPTSSQSSDAAGSQGASCIDINNFAARTISRGAGLTYFDVSWRADNTNRCGQMQNMFITFRVLDKDRFELDSDIASVIVPEGEIRQVNNRKMMRSGLRSQVDNYTIPLRQNRCRLSFGENAWKEGASP
jgi:hypothetical protein